MFEDGRDVLVVVDSETRRVASIGERVSECGVDEGEVRDEVGGRAVAGLGRPVVLVLHALKRSHAVRDAVANDLVHHVPRGNGIAESGDRLLDVLRDDVVHEVRRRDATREPGLAKVQDQDEGSAAKERTYRSLLVPEEVVPAEGGAVLRRVRLHGDAAGERGHAARGLRRVPLAAVLGDDVVEERAEDVGGPRGVGVVGVVRRAEVERLALARRDLLEDRPEVERARGRVAVVDEQVDGGRLRQRGRGEHGEEDEGHERLDHGYLGLAKSKSLRLLQYVAASFIVAPSR